MLSNFVYMEFNFSKIEKKWQKRWEDKGIFKAKESKKEKFYCLEMYPYPSGTGLHMGHAFNYTIGDVYARFKRMQGFNVLHPMGYDSFGLPAENAAIKAKSHPKKFTDDAIKNFIRQQKALGLSYDWDRKLQSHDPEFYKWNQWIFLKLYENGLVYKKKSSVNFCSKCNTVLANEQVHNGNCWRHEDTEVEIKQLEQWFIKITDYAEELLEDIETLDWPERVKSMQRNWIGKSEGSEVQFEIGGKPWKVFTTRPDTLYGVTFMVVSAQHSELMDLVSDEQKKEVETFLKKIRTTKQEDIDKLEKEGVFSGSYAIHPLTKEKVPVWIGNFVLAEYGSGMVMGVPAHDKRDFDFAKKYNLPVKQVIRKKNFPVRSYLMGASKIKDFDLMNLGIKIIEKTKSGDLKIEIPVVKLKGYEKLIEDKMDNGFWNEYLGEEIVFIFKFNDGKTKRLVLNEGTHEEIDKLASEFMKEENWNKSCVWKWLAENSFYTDSVVHADVGILINSDKFNGLNSREAKEHIIKFLESKKLGKKTIQYKLRDWLVSRQRYWGTPIPMLYDEEGNISPVNEKELPVKLPEKVEFGKGNPLETSKSFLNVKLNGKSYRRETDTMDTFFDSSWYFLRFIDSKNSKKMFDKKKADYWMPVDFYTGGVEHACMHLIYARFFTKVLRDWGFIDKNINEPFKRLFNQGMVHGEDGFVMSKSRGNVIDPLDVAKKYSADSLRLFSVSVASPDSDFTWNPIGLERMHKFLIKSFDYFSKVKIGKSDERIESKIHKTIKEITEDIENLKYNLAIIKLRGLFDYLNGKNLSKQNIEFCIKLLSPFCPHVAEELWEKIGGKGFVSSADWPKFNEKKINEKFEKEEELFEKLISDINHVSGLIQEKEDKRVKKVFVYVLPNEKENYSNNLEIIQKRTNLIVEIFSVSDKNKHDPESKSKKVKPNRPAIFLE